MTAVFEIFFARYQTHKNCDVNLGINKEPSKMPTTKLLEVTFSLPLKPYEVPAFRGAIIELVGRENVAFHNHIGEDKFVYKYPLIQYKANRGKAHIVCLNEGVEELYALFSKKNHIIRIGENSSRLNIDNINVSSPFIQAWDKNFLYSVSNWLPLSGENFKKYINTESLSEKIRMLEKIFIGHVLSFAKGIDWNIDKEIKVSIHEIKREKIITYKKVKLKAFDVIISSNIYFPNLIGLGKGTSTGFGVVKHTRKPGNFNE
ncbi:MAG: hypothetical protein EA358_00080 [Flavobacteriales bacterium]|nr:MAG: hypothetical protein EA358_00080 [Flavobacteriales bacterium]